MIYAIDRDTKEHIVVSSACDVVMYTHQGWEIIQADADGWIEWNGGECPLPDESPVSIKLGTGETIYNSLAKSWMWPHDRPVPLRIIAYRPILEPQAEQVKEWRGPEDGLPPVGTVCEFVNKDGEHGIHTGAKIKILCHYNPNREFPQLEVAVFCVEAIGGKRVDQAIKDCFRPIRTDRERWIEEARKESGFRAGPRGLGAIYDAGLARLPEE